MRKTTDASNADSGWNLENTYIQLPEVFYTLQRPQQVKNPKIAVFNHELAKTLGLNADVLNSPDGAALLSGNQLPEGARPLAQAYAGHQFGYFTLLGDGRAILLGEQVTPSGDRFDLQLKGAGRTPYSRQGDGMAALGPMLREYLISESMHGLGIPTTRSLAVVVTDDPVFRETRLQGAILTRVAASHLRVGTFQLAARHLSLEHLKALVNYTLQRHDQEAAKTGEPALTLLKGVIARQASLIARWMLTGFIHGVMNTDNMALSGETIDYGPCAFMDVYHPDTVFSSIDHQGRYAYGNQPAVGAWNLARFAETLLPLLHPEKEKAILLAQDALSVYTAQYENFWLQGMRAKLGLSQELQHDWDLSQELLQLMQQHAADYTNTFLSLTFGRTTTPSLENDPVYQVWYRKWRDRLSREGASDENVLALMKQSNPALIPRNHQVERALDAAVRHGDYTVLHRLMQALRHPYAHLPEQQTYAAPAPPSSIPYRTFCGT